MRPDNVPATISYRSDFKLWWPDYDRGPEKCYAFVRHHLSDALVGASYCKRRRLAIQAGGHAGLWPLELAKLFGTVHTFEPEEALFECLRMNIESAPNIVARRLVLGARRAAVKMRPSRTAGSWRVADDGTVDAEQIGVDELGLTECDLIQLDVEGYEVEALRGAEKTIKKHRPVIQVELLPRVRDAIELLVQEYGYKLAKRVHGDAIYVSR